MDDKTTLNDFVAIKNEAKKLFTAGPASLSVENLQGLEPCFGRGDDSYDTLETRVLSSLKELSGHSSVARLQGSGSMALEVMVNNFAYGKVLIVDSGYYAQRAQMMSEVAAKYLGYITEIEAVNWTALNEVSGSYDWVVACSTETSIGLKLDIKELHVKARSLGAKLMLDATASIGLEDNHELADAISYSSCKGLFGLTGGAFVAFNNLPDNEILSFNLSLQSHLEKKMTGPYHAICSLDKVLQNHDEFKLAVEAAKKQFLKMFESQLFFPKTLQPKLCTRVIGTVMSSDQRAILYSPRTLAPNESVVCHLGEVHLGNKAVGAINDCLSID